MECKICTATLPLTRVGKYAGMCATCTELKREQDERDQNQRARYEMYSAFGGAALFFVFGVCVLVFDLQTLRTTRILSILFLVLGRFGTAIFLFAISLATAFYGEYVRRGGKILY